jgi:single-stranded DNA-binding protein
MFTGQIIGYLGSDAKENPKEDGKVAISFSISPKGKQEKPTWVQCFYNRPSAIIDYLKKGTLVYVTGDVSVDVYKKEDGTFIPSITIAVSKIELLSKKED